MTEQVLTSIIGALQAITIALIGAGALRLGKIGRVTDAIGSEVKNNHGSTLRDAVDRVERLAQSNKADIDELREIAGTGFERLTRNEEKQAAGLDKLDQLERRFSEHIAVTTAIRTITKEETTL